MGKRKYPLVQVGDVFNRLTVIALGEPFQTKRQSLKRWRCKCTCGKECLAYDYALPSSRTVSCGCFQRESASIALRITSTTHGETGSPEHRTWIRMNERCYREAHDNYKHYGGRGISVCEQWRLSFTAFLQDVGRKPSPRHTLDRIDNNGNYEPSNVRWATQKEQCRNRRTNRLINIGEKVQTIAQWSDETGIKYATLYRRLELGWPPEKLLCPTV